MQNEIPLRHTAAVADGGRNNTAACALPLSWPKTILDVVDQAVGKVLDQFNVPHNLFRRWADDDS